MRCCGLPFLVADGGTADGAVEAGASPVELQQAGVVVDALRAEELWVDAPEGTIAARCGGGDPNSSGLGLADGTRAAVLGQHMSHGVSGSRV